jgi:ferredoxin-NADP reductase
VFFTETPDDGFAQRMAALPRAPRCVTGRIDLAVLDTAFGPAAAYYLAGPPVMLGALTPALLARGIAQEDIRTDAWE